MIVSEDFLSKARSAFDLNEYEIKTWTALLSRGESTAGELAEISTVPRSRVYDILEGLTKKGYVAKKNSTPIRYKTVSPAEALKAAKKNAQLNAETEAGKLEKTKATDIFKELDKMYKKGSEEIKPELVGLVKGRRNIHAHLRTMLADAKKSITIVSTKEGLLRKAAKLSAELKKAKDKGVTVRLVSTADVSMPESLKGVAELKKSKDAARFVIVDDRAVLFMMDHDDNVHESYDTGVLVNSGFFAKGFEQMFNNHWEKL